MISDDTGQAGEPEEPSQPQEPREPAPRWLRDSTAENAEVPRAREPDKLAAWERQHEVKPLTNALESHGVKPGNPGHGSWAGRLELPNWWDSILEPASACASCQRPGPAACCAECGRARTEADDPTTLRTWWDGLSPWWRRVQIAARFGTDPWSGGGCVIGAEWTAVTGDGEVRSGRHRYTGCTPDGIYWAARSRA